MILATGGANFVLDWLALSVETVISLDVLTHAGIGEITNPSVCALQLDPVLKSERKKYCQGSGAQP